MAKFKEYTGDRQEVYAIALSMQELESIVYHQLTALRRARTKLANAYRQRPKDWFQRPDKFMMEQAARIINMIQLTVNYQWIDLEDEVHYPDKGRRWHWSVDPHARTTPYPPENEYE